MKNLQTTALLVLGMLLLGSACVKPHYLSPDARHKTEETSKYRIERKILGASTDGSKLPFLSAWLELRNHTPWKTGVTIDCRFFSRTPNRPVANAVRTLVLQPWEVRVELFATVSLYTERLRAWCGMIDSEFIDTKK